MAARRNADCHPPAPIRLGSTTLEFGLRTFVMGIINMAPDSFAGDGFTDPEAALTRGLEFRDAGADILDVGGRSTRPGAPPVGVEEELRRTIPAIRRLAAAGLPISVDTSSARVAESAIAAGASMVNDVTALRGDAAMGTVVAASGAPIVLMDRDDRWNVPDVVAGTLAFLRRRLGAALACGIAEDRIIVDPGYGFGLTVEQNMEILRCLGAFAALGRPILVGTSRKGSIGSVLNLPVHERLEGTAATMVVSIMHGADIIRVHDVRSMVRLARMTDIIVRGPAGSGCRLPRSNATADAP
jgi:dihydropteroate synthase